MIGTFIRFRLVACALLAGAGLSACESSGNEGIRTFLGTDDEVTETAKPCPRAVLVDDAREIVDMAPGGRTFDDVRVAARLNPILLTCDLEDDRIGVRLILPMQGVRGPQLDEGEISFSLPYFVAVAEVGGRVLGKRVFTARLTIPAGQKVSSVSESIEQNIPLHSGRTVGSIFIYAGFQLTPAQLEFNRRNRLRF